MAVFFATEQELSLRIASAWTDLDVSAFVPASATGVILRCENTTASSTYLGFKMRGSLDDQTVLTQSGSPPSVWNFKIVGLDSTKKFQYYSDYPLRIKCYMIGYFESEAVFFTNMHNKTPSSGTGWLTIDCNPDTVGADKAKAAICYVPSSADTIGWRKKGSTDTRTEQQIGSKFFICGVNDTEEFEFYRAGTASIYVVGYLTGGIIWNENAIDISLSTISQWLLLPQLVEGANSALIQVVGSTGSGYEMGIRQAYDADPTYMQTGRACQFISKAANRYLEGHIRNVAVDFWLQGYLTQVSANNVIMPPMILNLAFGPTMHYSPISVDMPPLMFGLSLLGSQSPIYVFSEPLLFSLGFGTLKRGETADLADGLSFAEVFRYGWARACLEVMNRTEMISTSFGKIVREALSFLHTGLVSYGAKIIETLVRSEALRADMCKVIREALMISALAPVNWRGTEKIDQDHLLLDRSSIAKIFFNVLADLLTMSESLKGAYGRTVAEMITRIEAALSGMKAYPAMAEGIHLSDSTLRGWEKLIQDQFGGADAALSLHMLMCLASDTVQEAETITLTRKSNAVILDARNYAGAVTVNVKGNQVITEGIGFDLRLVINGVVYQAWVLNTNGIYPSVYSGFDFNSYAMMKGRAYAAKDDGVYLLEGTTDAGSTINTGARVNLFNMGTQKNKRIHLALFGVVGSQPAVKVIADTGAVSYYIVNKRAHVSQGQEGRKWIFELSAVDEASFIEIVPAILAR